MASKPTIMLLPGGMTHNTCFDRLLPYLKDYEVVVAAQPGADAEDSKAHTAESDSLAIQAQYLTPLLDAGKDFVIYSYSFGGTVLGTNGPSLVKSEREKRGERGGVVGIVYMSIATVPRGITQLDFLGGTWPPFIATNSPRPGVHSFNPIIPHLFNDIADPADQAELAKTVVPHAARPLETPVLSPLWADRALDGRRVWLMAMLDATFPPEACQAFIESSGVEWEVVERQIGHCGFVGHPRVVAEVVLGAVERWMR